MMVKRCSICGDELFTQENHFRKTKSLEVVCMFCFEKNMDVFPCTITPSEAWDLFCCQNGMQTCK